LLNEIFVYPKDIISKMTIVALRQKKVLKNWYSSHLRIVNAVVSLSSSRSDRGTENYFSPNWSYSCLNGEYNNVNEDNNDITKILDEFFFAEFCLFDLMLDSVSKLIHLLRRLHMRKQTNNRVYTSLF